MINLIIPTVADLQKTIITCDKFNLPKFYAMIKGIFLGK